MRETKKGYVIESLLSGALLVGRSVCVCVCVCVYVDLSAQSLRHELCVNGMDGRVWN